MVHPPRLEPPQRLVRNLGSAHPWLREVASVAEELIDRWRLRPVRLAAPGGRDSLVLLVEQTDGAPAALKLSSLGSRRVAAEAAALTRWDGLGAVRLLRADADAGALLLERLQGEVSLRSLPEQKAVLEAASVLRRLWVPPGDHPFPTVAEHTGHAVETLFAAAPAELASLVEEARANRERLLADAGEGVLLHGDFRQGAVLAAPGDRAPWLAVGPHPLVGDPAYDLARLARDRLHDLVASPGAAAQVRRRLRRLADSLELDQERLRGWAHYRAVESGLRHLAAGDREDGETLLEFAAWV
ncbi:kinase [Streptomyces sp. OF3]|uniref:Kinase n=1 Tax=Streptomyces alkaliterrae TaxID=2213162 RepID=A0A7W3ZMY3_9ACTN|nr:aminoglycoside phosphotransferase family protein [Streptomyces alkaliterrae]MBB1253857.1 kinase [Streptomyces alkaliterrae]